MHFNQDNHAFKLSVLKSMSELNVKIICIHYNMFALKLMDGYICFV